MARSLSPVVGTFEAGETNPYAVVSAEMLAAYEKLSNLARGLGLKTEYRVVSPPGTVDLNPTDLVVVGSPRILLFVGQVLASDPKLGFGSDDDGVYLVNRQTGEEFRSPSDSGSTPTPCDQSSTVPGSGHGVLASRCFRPAITDGPAGVRNVELAGQLLVDAVVVDAPVAAARGARELARLSRSVLATASCQMTMV
ncbi:Protein of unknown function [Micromonospora lupini str. Lupac 08]|uniref:Uncharacterized protein n=1 Tax=Micromonospora lupini str. Lupac 08 TaxID=1150864 RepID=I0L235_9ACTN|nr:Protein of unknown function [Micromonospora lupini str. Lupac 08]